MKYIFQFLTVCSTIILGACSFGGNAASSASPAWSWQGGSNESNAYGVYGTLGVASINNIPGARLGSISWVDNNGNFWLFGGAGNAANNNGSLNDLWEYNPNTSQWTWVGGSNSIDADSVYGERGVPSATNIPGARYGGVSWRDLNGNLWMFGGYGKGEGDSASGFLNDLWEYNPSTNMWVWHKGSKTIVSPGIYGVKGVAAPANTPGGRIGSVSWVDSSGNLWLFGGVDAIPGLNVYNDLWKYNINTNKWTWVSGDSTPNSKGIYGTKDVPDAANQPGARLDSIGWVDNHGNLWMFGGSGRDADGSVGLLNDLWKYDISTHLWTWKNGSSKRDQYGTYGSLGIGSATNTPGARDHRIPFAWSDKNGNLWMFGGAGYASSTTGLLNDLWTYNPNNNQWTWVGGSSDSNAMGSYGSLGSPSPTNIPGARRDAIGWIDANGNLWVFGGFGNGVSSNGKLNDLWKYNGVGAETLFPTVKYYTFPSYDSTPSNYITGIRGVTDTSNVYISVIWPSTTNSLGLVYAGPLSGQGGQWYQLNYPSSSGVTVKSTTLYGPNNGRSSGAINVVGSFTSEQGGSNSFGLLYQGPLTDGNNPNNWTVLTPPSAMSTIAHSNMGDLVVGNYNVNGNPAGKAFVYNIKTKTYFTLSKQGAVSITAYGIWYNGGTSYTIAGGYSNLDIQGLDIGYVADFDSSTNAITNWTSYSYNNLPIDSVVSHFEGITSDGKGGYNLAADVDAIGSLVSGNQPAFVNISRLGTGFSSVAKWTDIFYPGAKLASANTVFENNLLGVYSNTSGLDQVNSFVATVPLP